MKTLDPVNTPGGGNAMLAREDPVMELALPADRELRHHRQHAHRRAGGHGRLDRLALLSRTSIRPASSPPSSTTRRAAASGSPRSSDDVRSKQFYWPDTNVLITRFLHADGVGEIDGLHAGRPATRPMRRRPARPPGARGPRQHAVPARVPPGVQLRRATRTRLDLDERRRPLRSGRSCSLGLAGSGAAAARRRRGRRASSR